MANLFAGVEPPAWLQRIAQPISNESAKVIGTLLAGGTNALRNDTSFSQGLSDAQMTQQDPTWPIKAEQVKSLILERQAQMTAAYSRLALTNQQQAGMINDAALFSNFMEQTAGDPVKVLNTPMPAFSLPASAHRFLDMQNAASKSAAVIQGKALNTDIDKSLLAITDPALKAAGLKIIGMTDLEEKQQQASQLLQVWAGRQELERTKAETEAQLRGDVPTTRITDKGITTTFAAPKAGDVNAEPNTKLLPGGYTAIWMPGSKGVHLLKGDKEVTLTPGQQLSIAKESGDEELMAALVQQAREQAKLPKSKQGIAPIEQEPWHPMIVKPPAPAPAPAPTATAPTISTQQQFDALPSGAVYIGTDGKRYRKP